MEDKTFVINIGRQLGSGGKEIGLRLAEMFGITCYDNELIKRAAKESGIDAGNFENSDEKKQGTRSFFSNFIPFVGSGDIYGNPISEETLFRIQSETIKNCRRTFVHIHRTLCRLCASRQETLRQCFCFRRLCRPRKAALSAPRHNRASRRETYSPGRPTTFAILQLLFRRHLGFCRHLSPLHKFQRFRH